jgi:cytochrome c oxidase cbb3-type subunit III
MSGMKTLEELNNPLPRWWLNLFYITLFFAIIYLILYPGLGSFPGLLGWSSTGQYEQEMERAEEEYTDPCSPNTWNNRPLHWLMMPMLSEWGSGCFPIIASTCHGADARGVPGFPNLRNNDWTWGGDPGTIHDHYRAGACRHHATMERRAG